MQFEKELNHWGKGLTGTELGKNLAHDEIIMIRSIESNKEAIVKDPELLFPGKFTIAQVAHIYKEYCSSYCENIKDENGDIIEFPNISTTLIGDAVNLTFLHS